MLDELNNKLLEKGYDTQLDYEGIYIPKYNIDIIIEDYSFIIRPSNSEPIVVNSVEEAVMCIKDFSYSIEFSEELDKNHYLYHQESPRFFSIGSDKVKIIDGRFYLEDEEGETNIFINIPSIIGAIQSKFFGEK
ncbi:hypothetical protein [Staphylococcus aureus]|uniref:hypothetical protein n=1 Tax=Staphylococcus TaxID=1279 RepID=UPI000ADDDD91|nr:hypothetical protein [Staphylococcus aureus]MVG94949.1 hypothetical protein [Staphylococcus aureus]MVI00951.1 hypothetical protein [Staphylococcus aureus]MVI25690.1 hypothetical protein [Staphylococcus aureus]MVI29770.1 hypothetical protein [Staphylococcus aureus]MVI87326.1 hypothetical protein [Staphylococcus aureus]